MIKKQREMIARIDSRLEELYNIADECWTNYSRVWALEDTELLAQGFFNAYRQAVEWINALETLREGLANMNSRLFKMFYAGLTSSTNLPPVLMVAA